MPKSSDLYVPTAADLAASPTKGAQVKLQKQPPPKAVTDG